MKSNFHLLFYIRKQKNYKGGAMPIYMRITVNGCMEALQNPPFSTCMN
jgi:hypothetical protein